MTPHGSPGSGSDWIFGYGSLLWRVGFPYVERRTALLPGWVRRFWQGSTDHRGVPGRPGRVVTLVREPGAGCFGLAFRLPGVGAAAILSDLDHRERGGYQRRKVELRLGPDGEAARAVTYVATPANRNYLGPAPLAEIASQVRGARGPSGPNPEYVLRLAAILRAHQVEDPHVFELERLLRRAG